MQINGYNEAEEKTLHNPSDELMARFAKEKLKIKKWSESKVTTGNASAYVDAATGEMGVILSVGKIQWVSSEEVEVEKAFYRGFLWAGGEKLRVKKEKGQWVIYSTGSSWVS